MKTVVLVVFMSLLSMFFFSGTAYAVCGDGIIDGGEECDDGDTNDFNACRNDCTIYDPYFIDVPGSHWAFEYVQQLYEYAISQGYPDGTYQPGNNVSRAEMSAYVIRTIDLVGDVTSVTAGTGLTGGGDTGDVTLNADTTYLQRRVSSTCSAGSSIRTINENGTVVCEPDDGVGVETDPTVLASVKDGVSWPEVSGKPAGFADNVDDVGITSETDPQVGSNTTNYVPKWNGSALVTGGTIYDNGNIGIGTNSPSLNHKFHVVGNVRIDNMFRSGSESGTTEGPLYPNPGGIIVRKINSNVNTDGNVVAATDGVPFQRDGTNGGFKAVFIGFNTIICMGIDSSGANVNSINSVISSGTYTVYTNAQDVVYMSCSLGDPWTLAGHTTQLTIFRETGNDNWNGFMTSTYDQ
jgi:cysteine-rich repeat protein